MLVFFVAVAFAGAAIGQHPPAANGQLLPSPTPKPVPSASEVPTPAPPGPPTKLEGIWEVQMQRGAETTYSHFRFNQNSAQSGPAGDALAGIWRTTDGKVYPITGSYDGKNFKVVVTLADKSLVQFAGYVDSPSDMVGMAEFGKESVPFTAAHRNKVRLLDSIGPGLPGI